jgi:uncharacterized protein
MGPVVVLGASSDPSRYSNMAMIYLKERGFKAIPVHPRETEVEGIPVIQSLGSLKGTAVDTLTMYVSAALSNKMQADILALKPRRVIFNPGSENEELAQALKNAGAEVIEACTLVMLRTGQF